MVNEELEPNEPAIDVVVEKVDAAKYEEFFTISVDVVSLFKLFKPAAPLTICITCPLNCLQIADAVPYWYSTQF